MITIDEQYIFDNGLDFDQRTVAFGEATTLVYEITRGIRDFACLDNLPRDKKMLERIQRYICTEKDKDVKVKLVSRLDIKTDPDIFIYHPDAKWKIDRIKELKAQIDSKKITWPYYTRELGRIFCYSENQIEAFVVKCRPLDEEI